MIRSKWELAREKERELNHEKRLISNDRKRQQRKQKRELVSHIKRTNPCADCKQYYPPECMDFDHLPGTNKNKNISQLAAYAPLETIVDEIRKCQLVCANCHRIRTHNRRQS